MPQPKLLSKPWASDGLKNNIPAERNGGLAQEAATYAEGFPRITMTPISVGGKPPSGKDMNGVLYEISAHTVWQNQGGRYRFNQTFCDAIGGYPKGSVLISDTLDTEYISLVDANTHNPNSGNNTGKWAIHAGKGLKASTTQAGSVQLSSATNSDREDMAATPKAVKTAYDNSIRRGGAVGLGGQNHQIAIGWDTPGLIARVDNNVMNVGVPVGTVAYFAQDVPPFGWLKANGAAVSRTVYANLFAAIGERYGRGDGRTTFNLPDLRGEFIRSWDDGRAIDRNRALGSWQADEFRSHSHGIGVNRMSDTDRGSNPSTVSVDTVGQTDPAGGIETRPRNIALMACIKA